MQNEKGTTNGISPNDISAGLTTAKDSQIGASKIPLQIAYKPLPSLLPPFSPPPLCADSKPSVWKNIQAWYVIAFFLATLTFLQNLHFNNSSVIEFFKRNSQHAHDFFLAISLFLLLILSSHLAYIYLTGLAKQGNAWPLKKSSFNCYVFLTVYQMVTLLFVAIFCLQDEKFFEWMNMDKIAERNRMKGLSLHILHDVQLEEACCGYRDFRDYFRHKEYLFIKNNHSVKYSVPHSCCSAFPCRSMSERIRNLTIHRRGCSHRISKYIHRYTLVTSLSFFMLASIQSIIVILSFKVRSQHQEGNEKCHIIEQAHPPIDPLNSQYI